MTEPRSDPAGPAAGPVAQPVTTIKLGNLTLTGGPAVAALVGIVAIIVALVVWARPSLSNWPVWASAALWIAFISYWNVEAKKAAPPKSSESRESRQVHQRLMNLAFLLAFVPVPGLRQNLFAVTPVVIAGGLSVQIASGLLGVWARRHLGRNWSGAITIAVDHQLVRSGPYRTIRHPIYTAMIGMFIGTAIVSATPHAVLGVVVICAAYWRKIRLEEQNLRVAFGPSYDEYRRQSGALLPWVF